MSLVEKTTCICYVCKKESEQDVLISTSSFGSCDLDLRPPSLRRFTMRWWIQECPHCGYISESLEDFTSVDEIWLRSQEYRTARGIDFKSDLARSFYKHYLISLMDKNPKLAFHSVLFSAWQCDDSFDVENAKFCRKMALEQLEILISECGKFKEREDGNDMENYHIMRMDLLRRSNQFLRVIDDYSNYKFTSKTLNQIKDFQILHSQLMDNKRYTIADCKLLCSD